MKVLHLLPDFGCWEKARRRLLLALSTIGHDGIVSVAGAELCTGLTLQELVTSSEREGIT